ncbi:Palmitoyl-monogalactosyldiacylglycerol delta-7 desaturase, partial [Durusdinium trenchii]
PMPLRGCKGLLKAGFLKHDDGVFKVVWYMLAYGGPTPKPQYALSNSKWIQSLWTGALKGWAKRVKEARVTRDPETIQELSNLPSSGCLRQYPPRFGLKLVELFEDLIQDKKGLPPLPEVVPPAERMLESMFFEDLWPEAAIQDVCHYLRGGKLLSIPHSFRDVLPGRL